MRISYTKLWALLVHKKMKKKDLQKAAGLSSVTIAKMGKNEVVNTESLMKICKVLHCNVGDIVDFVENFDKFIKCIYSIEDVDGCGTNATVLISSTRPLTQEELQILKECLDDSKQEAADNGKSVNTNDMVADAMEKFQEKTGKILQFADDLISGYLTF